MKNCPECGEPFSKQWCYKCRKKVQKHLVNPDLPFKERIQAYKELIPQETHETFHHFVGQGYSPKVMVACINYIQEKEAANFPTQAPTQIEVADQHGVSPISIHQNYRVIGQHLQGETQ